ncbi:MAG: ribosome biogenesis GTPase Der [Rhodospirillales bacterium]|nr:ribosome biogenesis GTPase Der [Rhodospirillaceae bacterium]MDP6426843.1 ribosome biogenesis GTPase Der [Rhodospirillales bacterium]MDP6643431.1 ribosome biogenesis GTPase Der [Rhodospirillales bacterium]MDP6842493.1 ribosome biogenesis GTPase Der [Rhodospirillales bacterium]
MGAPFTIAIVGRPNVGKSTLFNRLAGKKLAIVDDTPGITRDRRQGPGRLGDLDLELIDTAGFEEASGESLEARMREQTNRAVRDADLVLFLIDARAGVTPLDQHFANWLRAKDTPVLLLANKCEGRAGEPGRLEAYRLGLGEPIAFSAEHGDGLSELYSAIQPFADAAAEALADIDAADEDGSAPMQLAIVGRPNVGKSTLLNRLVGEERMLTGPEAGITRDAIAVEWSFEGRPIRLIDTAGLRRRARVSDKVEHLSAEDSARAIQYAQLVVLVLDGEVMLERQDLTIARRIIDEGRVLVIAVNKWDAVKDKKAKRRDLEDRLEKSLPQIRGVPVVTLSALTGRGLDKLLPTAFRYFDVWNRRVPTAQLNRWLEEMEQRHPPPLVQGRRIRLRYMTQAKTRPPTFVLFSSRGTALPEDYRRYLVNGIRDSFDLAGIPLRLNVRSGKNPYAEE